MPQSGPKEGPCYRIEISEQEKNISDIEDECVIKRYAKQETAAAGLRGSRPSSTPPSTNTAAHLAMLRSLGLASPWWTRLPPVLQRLWQVVLNNYPGVGP